VYWAIVRAVTAAAGNYKNPTEVTVLEMMDATNPHPYPKMVATTPHQE
jgi:hypothetical protein